MIRTAPTCALALMLLALVGCGEDPPCRADAHAGELPTYQVGAQRVRITWFDAQGLRKVTTERDDVPLGARGLVGIHLPDRTPVLMPSGLTYVDSMLPELRQGRVRLSSETAVRRAAHAGHVGVWVGRDMAERARVLTSRAPTSVEKRKNLAVETEIVEVFGDDATTPIEAEGLSPEILEDVRRRRWAVHARPSAKLFGRDADTDPDAPHLFASQACMAQMAINPKLAGGALIDPTEPEGASTLRLLSTEARMEPTQPTLWLQGKLVRGAGVAQVLLENSE